MNPEIGLQIYSVRNELQRDYLATLESIAAIGYRNLELITTVTEDGLIFGQDMDATQLRRALDKNGLSAVSCHLMLQEKMNWEKILADCGEIGINSLVCPFALFENRQDVLNLCASFNRAAEICKKNGVQFYYHNHFQEFQMMDGQMPMDVMLETMDKDLVKIEFDTYWAMRGGQDVIKWLQRLGERCDLLHQKDLPASIQPVNLFELMESNRETKIFDIFTKTINASHFTEIGEGTIDIPAIIAACRLYGNARYIFVEQDMTSRAEMDSVKISYQNFSRLLSKQGNHHG